MTIKCTVFFALLFFFSRLPLIPQNKWIFYSTARVRPLCGLVSNSSWLQIQIPQLRYTTAKVCMRACANVCRNSNKQCPILLKRMDWNDGNEQCRIRTLVFSSHKIPNPYIKCHYSFYAVIYLFNVSGKHAILLDNNCSNNMSCRQTWALNADSKWNDKMNLVWAWAWAWAWAYIWHIVITEKQVSFYGQRQSDGIIEYEFLFYCNSMFPRACMAWIRWMQTHMPCSSYTAACPWEPFSPFAREIVVSLRRIFNNRNQFEEHRAFHCGRLHLFVRNVDDFYWQKRISLQCMWLWPFVAKYSKGFVPQPQKL